MILILCSPRTGSSMVAKIFAMHGCYMGETLKRNGLGYEEFENLRLKAISRAQWLDYNQNKEKKWGIPMNPSQKHLDKIAEEIKNLPEKAVFKTIIEFYKLFLQFKPKIILIRRNEENAVRSMADKHNESSPEQIKEGFRIHRLRMKAMEQVEQEYGAKWINTDELILGNYSSLEKAFEYCGLEFNSNLAEQAIDKKLWHYV